MKQLYLLSLALAIFTSCSKDSDSGPGSSGNKFELAWETSITVPSDYNHNTQLSTFYDALQIDPSLYTASSGFLNDALFTKTTDKLVPGKTYNVKFYDVESGTAMSECVKFAQDNDGLLTNVQGLTLGIMVQAASFLVSNKDAGFYTPDHRETMPTTSSGQVVLPYAVREGQSSFNYAWDFKFIAYDSPRNGGYLVVYFNQ